MSKPALRILVPTSERKHGGGTGDATWSDAQAERGSNRFPSLTRHRRLAVDAFLAAINGQGHAARVLGLEGEALEEAQVVNHDFLRSPLLPTCEREAGPLFRALREALDDRAVQRRAARELLVVCPLLGVLGVTDLVPAYRCPVGAQIPGFGSLHAHWKPVVSATLNRLVRRRRVVSFLTGRHLALWERNGSADEVVHVRFKRRTAAGLRGEAAAAGGLAGDLARALLARSDDPEAVLGAYESPAGHRLAPAETRVSGRERVLVFVR